MIQEKVWYVYKITNLITGKSYVGQHVKRGNKEPLRDGYMGSGILINRALKKYGVENFKKEILEDNIFSDINVNKLEQKYITEENTLLPSGYNLTTGGCSHSSFHESVKRKISKSVKKKYETNNEYGFRFIPKEKRKLMIINSTITKQNKSLKEKQESSKRGVETRKINGKPWISEETKVKISKSIEELHESGLYIEAVKALQKSQKEYFKTHSAWNKGKSHSEETRIKMSLKHKGRKCSSETRKKISQNNKGKPKSEEHKRNLSIAHMGIKYVRKKKYLTYEEINNITDLEIHKKELRKYKDREYHNKKYHEDIP